MRELGAEAERLLDVSRRLMPRYDEVALGGAHMDPFFKGNAIEEFLRALRKGHAPDTAAIFAKAAARDSVRTWNRQRGGDYQTHRWESTADDYIDAMARHVEAAFGTPQGVKLSLGQTVLSATGRVTRKPPAEHGRNGRRAVSLA